MGDIPYSETNMGADGLYKPKYDTQEQILIGILDELKEADQYFAQRGNFYWRSDTLRWRPLKMACSNQCFCFKSIDEPEPKGKFFNKCEISFC